jgi:hypothetical protein
VPRLGLAIIVALLAFSATGLSALVVAEPCAGDEQPVSEHGGCAPTCVTCGCCAQAVEPAALAGADSPEALVVAITPFVPRVPTTRARDILHVPRRPVT